MNKKWMDGGRVMRETAANSDAKEEPGPHTHFLSSLTGNPLPAIFFHNISVTTPYPSTIRCVIFSPLFRGISFITPDLHKHIVIWRRPCK